MRHLLLVALAAVGGAAGAQNTGLDFVHGSTMHFDVPYDPLVVPRTGLTIEAWITYDDTAVPAGAGFRWPTIVRQDVDPADESYFLRVGAGSTGATNLQFAVRTPTGLNFCNYAFAPGQLASWTHLAATYDGTMMRIYVGGVEVQSATAPAAGLLDTGGVLRVGNGDESNPGFETWSGSIDELRIWPFARTAAEIAATMNESLVFMPAGVLTFNLDSTFADSSSGLVGVPVGGPTFAPSPPLTMVVSGGNEFGASTSSCTTIRTGIGSPTSVGNPAFAVWAVDSPRNAAGFFFASTGALPGPLTLFGFDVWIDPTQIFLTLPAASGPLGSARVHTPVPNDPTLIGQTFFAQLAFLRPNCAVINFVSSSAVAMTIL